jgi:hypothetical protein
MLVVVVRLSRLVEKLTVKPIPPMRFQAPMCQPRMLGAGMYHFGCVSIVNRRLPELARMKIQR